MKQSKVWLLALLSILTLAATSTLAIAEDDSAHLSGKVEIGVTAVDLKDNPARVNEYAKYRSESDGLNLAPSLNLEYIDKGILLDFESSIKGSKDQKHGLGLDVNRIFKLDLNYQTFEHWLDHETLDQMGATMKGDIGGGQPSVTTDQTFADVYKANGGPAGIGGATLDYDPAAAVAQELSNDYIITHREFEGASSLTLPSLPNVTFHAGVRVEQREGLKQAIGVTKCDSCHVSATGKKIDEQTKDLTLGATGKFGLVTVDYEFLTRTFDEDGATPVRYYEDANNPSANDQLLYENGALEFNRTPDSEKTSHHLKARVDLTSNTVLSAAYTKANVESNKKETANNLLENGYTLAGGDTLKTEYESFGGKVSTRFGALRLSAYANSYTIDADGNEIELRDDLTTRDDNNLLSFDLTREWVTAEERDVTEFGIDAVYRLARATTLRLGYAFEDVQRDEADLGETETSTYKIALQSRLNKQLSGRISYQYQDISDPFHGEDATGIAQGIGTTDPLYPGMAWLETFDFIGVDNNNANSVWYWNSVYPNRTLDATNQPDTVHEAKFNTTWSPTANSSMSVFARYRSEENSEVSYEQKTFVPGVSFYYAPTGKLNLTMAYTFNKQETENQMCVGWYHG